MRRVQLEATPRQLLAAWPVAWPLAAIWSGDETGRWTVLARPREVVEGLSATGDSGLVPLSNGIAGTGREGPPFIGGWIGFASYDAGRMIEPRSGGNGLARAEEDREWPECAWARCEEAMVFDHRERCWWAVGGLESEVLSLQSAISNLKSEISEWASGKSDPWFRPTNDRASSSSFEIGPLRSGMGRERYTRTVERAIEFIRAGDVYQVNLAHRLSGSFQGSARGLFGAMSGEARPRFGCYIEWTRADRRRAIGSISPELFLEFDPATRRVTTRPMKGTRPASGDPSELEASVKDRAELNMIVDLMRNDLGRVCELGSVRVVKAREIERHGGRMLNQEWLNAQRGGGQGTRHRGIEASRHQAGEAEGAGILQATATVSGVLREGLGVADLLRATFPAGSVTGAPKIRAMQIIDELEPVRRGPYCGCVGYISDSGHAAFNVAIRTALVSGRTGSGFDGIEKGVLDYSVGAGIVADSVPNAEWEETIEKVGVFRRVLSTEY